jgi:hypothetical protein
MFANWDGRVVGPADDDVPLLRRWNIAGRPVLVEPKVMLARPSKLQNLQSDSEFRRLAFRMCSLEVHDRVPPLPSPEGLETESLATSTQGLGHFRALA